MWQTYSDSRTYNAGTSVNLVTLSESPDLVTVAYNYTDANGIPQSISYVLGARTTELSVYITKQGSGSNKTYVLTVSNNSTYRLYLSVAVWSVF